MEEDSGSICAPFGFDGFIPEITWTLYNGNGIAAVEGTNYAGITKFSFLHRHIVKGAAMIFVNQAKKSLFQRDSVII